MKFSAIALFVIASAIGAEACKYCQCLFPDGGNCCLAKDSRYDSLDCTAICAKSRRDDGTTTETPDGRLTLHGTACAPNGSYKCATVFQQKHRTGCVY
ncbi:hypothetical protein NHQ30_001563 [Ciborinia camelliae]|nr:hypothetical protein NHQ30_001563 [Ciborinia camelliae]